MKLAAIKAAPSKMQRVLLSPTTKTYSVCLVFDVDGNILVKKSSDLVVRCYWFYKSKRAEV
jgi:hypothetical protein